MDFKDVPSKYIISDELKHVLMFWQDFLDEVKLINNKTLPVIWLDEMMSEEKIEENFPDWKKNYIINMREIYNLNKKVIRYLVYKYKADKFSARDKKFEFQAGVENKDLTKNYIQLRQSGIRIRKSTSFPTFVAISQTPIYFNVYHDEFCYLTPIQSLELMGWKKEDLKEVSKLNDKEVYKVVGNSMIIPVMKYNLQKLNIKKNKLNGDK